MKYDLGGTYNHDGYISVNLRDGAGVKANILALDSFCEDGSVEEFFLNHTYEHLSPTDMPLFLKNILRKLIPNGILRIVHTDIKRVLELYKNDIIDFRALRDTIFVPVSRRLTVAREVGFDAMGHKYMWGVDELIEELLFYGFKSAVPFEAGYWQFDYENYFPQDQMQKFYNVRIPNLGVVAYK